MRVAFYCNACPPFNLPPSPVTSAPHHCSPKSEVGVITSSVLRTWTSFIVVSMGGVV